MISPALVASLAANRRNREFPDSVTFWGFLARTLSDDKSCARGVAEIQNWRQDHGQKLPSAVASPYCKARRRLPAAMLDAIHADLCSSLDRALPTWLLWHGIVVKAVDSSSVQLPDTPENQHVYPQPANQKPGCGFPVMQFGGLINLCHGGWEQFVASELTVHDHNLLDLLMPHIGKNEVLLGDRAFGSYEMFARVTAQGAWMLARLHQARKADWRKGKKAGPNQRVVTWTKPKRSPGSKLTPEQWAALPEEMTVRLIKVKGIGRPGRQEPRAVKRRPKPFPLLTKPRREYHEDFARNATLAHAGAFA